MPDPLCPSIGLECVACGTVLRYKDWLQGDAFLAQLDVCGCQKGHTAAYEHHCDAPTHG